MSALAVVVVPARDEEERVGACLGALAVQAGVAPGDLRVVVVLDGCTDGTAQAVETARRTYPWLPVTVLETPGVGAGLARRHGMLAARDMAPRLLCSTDADSRVGREWLAAQLAAVRGGADAVSGLVELDAVESAQLDPDVLAVRATEARTRLQAVRGWAPDAEHAQFSAASVALTCAAHDAVGGIPARPVAEDDELERALRAAGLRIAYRRGVRVTTSARPGGRMTAPGDRAPAATAAAPADGTRTLVVEAPSGQRGAAVAAAVRRARSGPDVVVVLPAGVPGADAAAEALAAPLLADDDLVLVKAVPPVLHPLDEVLARPLLELHAPALAAVRSPLAQGWAMRRGALERLDLPPGDAADIAVLVDVFRDHGLPSIAQVPVDLPEPALAESATLSYTVLAAVGERARGGGERPAVGADARFQPGARSGDPSPAW